MKKEVIKYILRIISEEAKNILWRIDGSANLFVQGLDCGVKDIDIITNSSGIAHLKKQLKEYISKSFYNSKKSAESLILLIKKEEVEINYYDKVKIDLFKDSKEITWEGLKFKVLPLNIAEKFYRDLGIIEKADKIKEFIA